MAYDTPTRLLAILCWIIGLIPPLFLVFWPLAWFLGNKAEENERLKENQHDHC